jgi:hypothetical protein
MSVAMLRAPLSACDSIKRQALPAVGATPSTPASSGHRVPGGRTGAFSMFTRADLSRCELGAGAADRYPFCGR